MGEPLVSIVTPTKNREKFLSHAYAGICAQTLREWEWLVDDDSASPSEFMKGLSDGRVKYHHDTTPRTLGAKRNDLIARARGEIIAQFDDDDYYAPKYLSTMVGALRERGADFVKLSGWFLLGAIDGSFGYWNTEVRTGLRFRCDGREAKPVMLSEEDGTAFSSENGFGFSYVFKRELWEKTKFRDVNFAEDGHFQREAIEGRSMMYVVDQGGICLHILHGKNTACCFPQYLLPPFMVRVLFPGAGNYLNAMMGDRGK